MKDYINSNGNSLWRYYANLQKRESLIFYNRLNGPNKILWMHGYGDSMISMDGVQYLTYPKFKGPVPTKP